MCTGGNSKLAQLVKGLMVYGGEGGIGALNHRVKHEEKFKVGSLEVTALSTPCHTSGHVCYYIANDQGTTLAMKQLNQDCFCSCMP